MRSASAGEGSHEQSIRSNKPEAETILIERKNVSSRGLTEMFRPVERWVFRAGKCYWLGV